MKKALLVAFALPALMVSAALAQDSGETDLTEPVHEAIDLEKTTQTNLDDWSAERQALDVRYRTAKANIAFLQERLARQRERAGALDGKVDELERRLAESVRLNSVIQDSMDAVLNRLTRVVDADLPFLAEEREARLSNLRHVMAAPDLTPAEKLRVLLEALLVETHYGETVEVAPATIVVDGKGVHADILRIGRLTMYWRSPDGSRIGTWDPVSRTWLELPGKYNRVISRSMEMASRMRPAELVSLPLGRIAR